MILLIYDVLQVVHLVAWLVDMLAIVNMIIILNLNYDMNNEVSKFADLPVSGQV